MSLAPVALFAYNRPEHLRKTLDALLADPLASQSELHVFCDAAKRPEHASAVAEVRRMVRSITGFCTIAIVERESNFGLAKSIREGVGALCATHGRVIVLEDDLLVAPGFLGFMNAGLARYQNDAKVYQISAYMYPGCYPGDDDALFLPTISCWGWATWARAWAHFDPSLAGLAALQESQDMRHRFNLHGAYDYFSMAKQQSCGKIDSWGICWNLSVFMQDGLVLFPRESLVQNIGVDASGTHGKGHAGLQKPLGERMADSAPLRLPAEVKCDDVAMRSVELLLSGMRDSFLSRLINWLRT
jgi:hypothetical protein